MSRIELFRGMSREQFLGNPEVVHSSRTARLTRMFIPSVLKDVAAEPFMDKYTARIVPRAIAVFDGDKQIAVYIRYPETATLLIDPAYRGQHIATEMVYELCIRTEVEKWNPPKKMVDTVIRIMNRVYDRIQTELGVH